MMTKYLITVFTPTFNREDLLLNTYISLLQQSFLNFEWLIIDDGSTDNTGKLILSFIEQQKINIRYIYQANGGKHRAINTAAELAQGEYIFILDSDDTITSDCLEIGQQYLKEIEGQRSIAGVAFRLKYNTGELVGHSLPFDRRILTYFELRYNLNYNVDFKEFTKTSILKEFKYPDIMGEKFCSEALVWNRISEVYSYLFVDRAVYCCEYLEGGLTSNIIKNRRDSSTYALIIYKELYNSKNVKYTARLKAAINYWRFSFFNKANFFVLWGNLGYKGDALVAYFLSVPLLILDSIKLWKKRG